MTMIGNVIDPPKVFIGSSGRALKIARDLHRELKKISQPILWKNIFPPGTNILQALLETASECDFAAILFTKDDLTEKKGTRMWLPRDNCIYEAGLFTGSLG